MDTQYASGYQECETPDDYHRVQTKLEPAGWSFKRPFYWANTMGRRQESVPDTPLDSVRTFLIAYRGDVSELLYSNRKALGPTARLNFVAHGTRRAANQSTNASTPTPVYWHVLLLVTNHHSDRETHTLVIGESVFLRLYGV